MRTISACILAVLVGACASIPQKPPVAGSRPDAPLYHAAFGAASCVAGSQDVSPVATLTFTPPTTNMDGTPISGPLTYDLYEGISPGAETQVATGIAGSPDVISSGLKGGATYYFELTAVDAHGVESPRSDEVCKQFPMSPPNAFTITIK